MTTGYVIYKAHHTYSLVGVLDSLVGVRFQDMGTKKATSCGGRFFCAFEYLLQAKLEAQTLETEATDAEAIGVDEAATTGTSEAVTGHVAWAGTTGLAEATHAAAAEALTGTHGAAHAGGLTELAAGAACGVLNITVAAACRLFTGTVFTAPTLGTDSWVECTVGFCATGAVDAEVAGVGAVSGGDTLAAAAADAVRCRALAGAGGVGVTHGGATGGTFAVGVTGIASVGAIVCGAALNAGALVGVPNGAVCAVTLVGVFAGAAISDALTGCGVAHFASGAACGLTGFGDTTLLALEAVVGIAVEAGLACHFSARGDGVVRTLVGGGVAHLAIGALGVIADTLVFCATGLFGVATGVIAAAIDAALGILVTVLGGRTCGVVATTGKTDACIGFTNFAGGAFVVVATFFGRIDALAGEVTDFASGAIVFGGAGRLGTDAVDAGLRCGAIFGTKTLGFGAALVALAIVEANLTGQTEVTAHRATGAFGFQAHLAKGAGVIIVASDRSVGYRIFVTTAS